MENNFEIGPDVPKNSIPFLSMNEMIMESLEESIKKGQKIELIPFKKWQAERCAKHSCDKEESV
jgi:hypothetical protein